MKKLVKHLSVLTFGSLVLAVGVAAAQQSTQPGSQTYSWSGELVALDQGTRMMTVKTQLVGDEGKKEVTAFKPGDRVVLTWSGFDDRAYYIRGAARYDAARKIDPTFAFAAEFVSSEPSGTGVQYLTFKTQIPAASVPALKSLKPGEWVTATARHNPSSDAEAVTSVRPFVTPTPGSTD